MKKKINKWIIINKIKTNEATIVIIDNPQNDCNGLSKLTNRK